jgi:hypothetical protein
MFVAVDVSSWWMRATQIAFGIVIAAELIALAVLLLRPTQTVSAVVAPVAAMAAPQPDALLTAPPSIAASVSRPLFAAPNAAGATTGSGRPGAGGPSEDAKALAARLSLIGIMGGAAPQVIIEDTQTKKTFSVTVGQSLIEGLVVAEVRADRVVLDLNGEQIELSL